MLDLINSPPSYIAFFPPRMAGDNVGDSLPALIHWRP